MCPHVLPGCAFVQSRRGDVLAFKLAFEAGMLYVGTFAIVELA